MFQRSLNSEIYVDKSLLIAHTNALLNTQQCYLCVSRPRRFGKSMAAQMLAAYYDRTCDSSEQFRDLAIAKDPSYEMHRNKYNVIQLNMHNFLTPAKDMDDMLHSVDTLVCSKGYADVVFLPRPGKSDPAIIIELKVNEAADTATDQIKARNHPQIPADYAGEITLCGISYDKATKKHECRIERM